MTINEKFDFAFAVAMPKDFGLKSSNYKQKVSAWKHTGLQKFKNSPSLRKYLESLKYRYPKLIL